ncbi:hypothetical protein RND71_039644 [Anisodus tanguticus]|uniref:Disease resistance protein RPS4B/Roq1-like leucine-rich repeats domain-containing protein n=1 Tax=Anisodus tanguticus TaxID=243964 RepID=A0AAE1QX19_9SOLA|nr:hypothetical protein RND71_039644 [Anisodus tanguticus]
MSRVLHGSWLSETLVENVSICIQHIVKEIFKELCPKLLTSGTLVGAESQIQAIEILDTIVFESSLLEVHQSVGALKKLTILDVEGCEKVKRLPTKFQSGSLEILNYSGCRSLRKVYEIQQNVNRLSEFKQPYSGVLKSLFEHGIVPSYIDLNDCSNIETLPSSICRLKNLKFLYLIRCSKLKNLPENIGDLENLEGLDASETAIWRTPNSIIHLRKLKFLCFRKVPTIFHVRDLCSWGCFAQHDLNFQLPSVLSVFCTLEGLDLIACNLFDGSVPEDLGCFASLLELSLSRNTFTYLPKSIAQLNHLQHLDLTYCEKLKELPELPPRIVRPFVDDRFALQSIRTLPTMYKKLNLVSFANRKMQKMWCASLRESSGLQMENCPRENTIDMLQEILPIFLSMVQLKTKVYFKGKGKDPLLVNYPNDYCRLEASLDGQRSTNWGIRLVYAYDIEAMRLKWTRQFKRDKSGYLEEEVDLWVERLEGLLIQRKFNFSVEVMVARAWARALIN